MLDPGTKLTHYEILDAIGAGGMGEVYRARDTRLEREVAIKVLPLEFVDDEDRLRRFEREAKTLASLHHPNVASIFGIDQVGDTCFLALELVAGEDLSELLAGGPLPLDQALDVCRQIAEGLEAAHDAGVIHRDLKPANVRVTPEGNVKVLDFGLAKPIERGASGIGKEDSFLATQEGLVLGTPTYMSPEQARARPVDRRTDIWAFGCVLFECLTGKRAFGGEAMADILSAIVASEPDSAALPADTPPRIRQLLHRCFEKDPRRRLRDIGEARLVLEGSGELPRGEARRGTDGTFGRGGRSVLPWALSGVLALALAAALLPRIRSEPLGETQAIHVSLRLPSSGLLPIDAGLQYQTLAISPDGERVAFLMGTGTKTRLAVREFDTFKVTDLAGTEGATSPFFSPDGRWIGFFVPGRLMKVSVDGGPPAEIGECGQNRGGVWAPGGTIIFPASSTTGLVCISENGGPTRSLTELDGERGERSHRWPALLPGGKEVLFTVGTLASSSDYEDSRIDAVSIETGERRSLLEGASMARVSESGRLLFSRGGLVHSLPLAEATGGVPNQSIPVVSGVAGNRASGVVFFDIASNGTLVFAEADPDAEKLELAWMDRDGTVEPLPFPARQYSTPRISPDGRSVAVGIGPAGGGESDIWVGDIATGSLNRLTAGAHAFGPVWSGDGRQIAYLASAPSGDQLIRCSSDGTGSPEVLLHFADSLERAALSLTPGDTELIYQGVRDATGEMQTMVLNLEDGQDRSVQSASEPEWWSASLSPDGRFLLYAADDAGRQAVYVRPYPGLQQLWQVSEGGGFPRWSPDGKQIFYIEDQALMGVSVETDAGFTYTAPREFYPIDFQARKDTFANFDVGVDGRLLVVRSTSKASMRGHLNVILHALDG